MSLTFRVLLCATLFLNCTSSKVQNCNENFAFKKAFYRNIEQVENYVVGNGNRLEFKKSLEFLSKYVRVSNEKMLNYDNSYTTIADFKQDKKDWLDWYEKNRCNNLQLKDSK